MIFVRYAHGVCPIEQPIYSAKIRVDRMPQRFFPLALCRAERNALVTL